MAFPRQFSVNVVEDDPESDEEYDSEEEEEDEYGYGFGGFGGFRMMDFEDRPHSAGSSVPTEDDDMDDEYDEVEPESVAAQIGDVLKNAAENVGEFTFGGPASDLPGHPGLQVDGFGLVTLPLVDPAQADRLAQCGRMAPFGLDSETVLDPQVRRTWQFDAPQVKIANPEWDRGLAKLVSTIAARLGCPNMPLECHLYKLLLYGPGCHFVRHRDTEKEDRMFATLVVQLASAHEGGALVVYQPDGTAVSHDFGAADGTSPFMHHYALHYADAEHELKTVTSGYRLALVYSICWPEGHKQVDLLQSLPAQQRLATHLTDLAQDKLSFFFMLEHQYTPLSIGRLRIQALKGKDRARALLVQAANGLLPEQSAFTMYLVQGSRDVRVGIDDCGTSEEFNPWTEVTTGKQFESSNTNPDLGQLINPEGKTKKELWSAKKQRLSTRYTGNEGYQIHNRYDCHILVAIPKTLGPYAILPYIGMGSISQLIDIKSCSVADFNAFLCDLPDPLKDPPAPSEDTLASGELDLYKTSARLPNTKTDFTAKTLEAIIDRCLVECVPTYFANVADPLSAAKVPIFVHAMKQSLSGSASSTPTMWSTLRQHLISALPQAKHPFMFGLKLIAEAIVAKVPTAVWADLVDVIAALPAPSHMFRSMPNILSTIAKHPLVWNAVHNAVAKSLATTLKRNKPINTYPSTSPHVLVFKLALSLAVTAAEAEVGQDKLVGLIDVLKMCDPAKRPTEPKKSSNQPGPYHAYHSPETVDMEKLISDCLINLQAATCTPLLWQAVLPLVCRSLGDAEAVPNNRFAFGIELVTDLLDNHSPTTIEPQLWRPVLEAATSRPGFLNTTDLSSESSRYGGYSRPHPEVRYAAPYAVKAMRYGAVWSFVVARVAKELQQDQQRFARGVFILTAAQKEASIPASQWIPLVPIVFATVPRPTSYELQSAEHQLAFWSVLASAAQRHPQALERAVKTFVDAKEPHNLKHAASAIVAVVSRNPTLAATVFLPLLSARQKWLDTVLPPAVAAPPSASPASTSWVIPNASYPSDARIDQFLKTNQATLKITGFSGIADARAWARQHPPPTSALRQQLSVEAGGVGKRAYVEVRKIRPSTQSVPMHRLVGLPGGRVACSSYEMNAAQAQLYHQEAARLKEAVRRIQNGQPVQS